MKRLSSLLLLGSVAAFLLASAPLALAQGTYTQIDVPGATETAPFGIDAAGDICGEYSDASYNQHGFLLSNGIYTTIDPPGGIGTTADSINNSGQTVGSYFANGTEHGFLATVGHSHMSDFYFS